MDFRTEYDDLGLLKRGSKYYELMVSLTTLAELHNLKSEDEVIQWIDKHNETERKRRRNAGRGKLYRFNIEDKVGLTELSRHRIWHSLSTKQEKLEFIQKFGRVSRATAYRWLKILEER